MRNVVLQMQVSIDGFVGGPNGELEWIFGNLDGELKEWLLERVWQAGVHVMGGVTYNDMAAYWPNPGAISPGEEMFAAPMNEIPKVVFSRTLKETAWAGSRVAGGDLREEIANLKQEPGKDILVHGGARFAQSLAKLGLVDEYRLIIHPVALGRGLSLFSGLSSALQLKLLSARAFPAGAVAHVYGR